MKIIVIGGYPGSGKSTIMRGVIRNLAEEGEVFKRERIGIVNWMESSKVVILGDYNMHDVENDKFPGTDRLPLNVQPDAQRFIFSNKDTDKVIILEGDRLFNDKMLSFIKMNGFQLVLCIVSVNRDLLEVRRNSRSKQNASWRKGRETKVDRIAMTYPIHHHLKNDTQEEKERSVEELIQEIKGEWKSEEVKSKIRGFWS